MRIWALSDGATGHRRQAVALAEALAVRLTAKVEPLILEARWPARWLAPRAGRLEQLLVGDRPLAPPWPDLAIGCGRVAALATRRLRELGVRAVQILDPGLAPARWDWVIAPRHDRLAGENVLNTLGSLHPLEPERLSRLREKTAGLAAQPAPRTLLLVGGPSRLLRWGRRDLARLIAILRHWLERDGGSLSIALSRRTPGWASRALRRAFPLARFTPEGGENLYEPFLAWADRIVVTADSVNMLSEACASGRPVRYFAPNPPAAKLAALLFGLVEGDHARPLRLELGQGGSTPLVELPALADRIVAELRGSGRIPGVM